MSEDKWASYHVCAARLGANDVTEGASVERVVQVVTIMGTVPKASAPG